MNSIISQKLKHLRIKHGLSQLELGQKLGISNRAISKWEKGISMPSSENIYRLSKIFGVSIEYFYNDSEDEENIKITSGMESLTELFKIGRGPSSSHTIGPENACKILLQKYKEADYFEVTLYGSLSKTGKGHGTDTVILKTLAPKKVDIKFDYSETKLFHPNTMSIKVFKENTLLATEKIFSIGGGSIMFEDSDYIPPKRIYKLDKFHDIYEHIKENNQRLYDFAIEIEDEGFFDYMRMVWQQMKESIKEGLKADGILPGGLNLQRKAKTLLSSQHIDESAQTKENRMVCAYAFAVSEQNASGETIVTAPTCGASGVVPAVLYYHQIKSSFTDDQIVKALITAGIIGNLIKTNASISGAECGCQAEVGTACAMAAAALGELHELDIEKIEYAAEIAIEHHLGLTCDPICGLVQIPCIERNAVAAMRAINAVNLASLLWSTRKISLDNIIETMRETGRDLKPSYRETSEAGLAKINIK